MNFMFDIGFQKYKFKFQLFCICITLYTVQFVNANAVYTEMFSIATGSSLGLYNVLGQYICDSMNSSFQEKDSDNNIDISTDSDAIYKCSTETTLGSFYNLNALKLNNIELGIAQYDLAEKLYTNSLLSNNFGMLRTLLEFYLEGFTIIVKGDSNIYTLDDIEKKRLNLGITGTGIPVALDALLEAKGWRKTDNFSEIIKVNVEDQIQSLCDSQIDIAFGFIGHPDKTLNSVCNIRVISIPHDIIDKITSKHPYYVKYDIPSNAYGNNEVITTFGVKNALFATTTLSDNIAKYLVIHVINNIDALQLLHSSFANLTPASLLPKNDTLPIHDGALLAFEELGISDISVKKK